MSATATAPARVLMVEDDERDFLLARDLFAATGRDLRLLEWVRTAEEALARLRENCHPIVLLDLRLGAASGLDVLRQARAAGCRSRFIFIVTHTGDVDDAGLIGEGADDYLAKDQITAPLLDRALRYALQRHHLDEARRESEGRFEQLANATPALLYVTDARGEHVFFNQSWLDFRGVARGAETLESWREAIHPEDRDRLAAHFARWLEEPRTAEVEYRFRRYDGEYRWVLDTSRPRLISNGRADGYVGSLIEIHERKRVEQDLAVARDLAIASSRLKSQFLANMSHEIRTPMNGIIGMSGLLLDTPLSPEQRELAMIVQKSADSLLTVINDILDFSKIESGRLDAPVSEFDLRALLEDGVALLGEQAYDKGLEIAADLPDGLPESLVGDAAGIRQVLMNLLGNAIKFTDAGEVVVGVKPLESADNRFRFRLEVRDTGMGIGAAAQAPLFQPFVQLDGSSTRRHGGNGLGLAISRELAVRMGAQIGCDSRIGSGSTFWLELALPRGGTPVRSGDDASIPPGARVLLVEPGRTYGRVLGEQLRRAGMDTHAARTADEALDVLRRAESDGNPFSLVLVERELGDPDGVALVRRIRSEPALTGLKVVLLAPASRLLELAEARELQLQSFLVKPVREVQLRQCLARVLRAPTRNGARGLEFLGESMRPGAASRLRVLLVEDNQINQKVGLRHLQRLGHDCDVAQNGRHALEMLALQRYDLVLMDCQMPELDGYETTHRIRGGAVAGSNADVPIIAITAFAAQHDRERCLEAGMNDYITKPLRFEELQAVIERHHPAHRRVMAGSSGPVVLERVQLEHLNSLQDEEAPNFLQDLIDLFLRETPQRLAELGEAFGRGDVARVVQVAHTLKGACANFGARELQGLCADLEGRARDGQLPQGESPLDALQSAFARLAEALKLQRRRTPA